MGNMHNCSLQKLLLGSLCFMRNIFISKNLACFSLTEKLYQAMKNVICHLLFMLLISLNVIVQLIQLLVDHLLYCSSDDLACYDHLSVNVCQRDCLRDLKV